MSLFRVPRAFRPSNNHVSRVAFTNQRVARYSDYGSGDGNPVGENPQKQGKNPREDVEHPGPPPPSTEGGEQKQTKAKDSGKPQPKIFNEKIPAVENQTEEVKQHNREMDRRADRAHATNKFDGPQAKTGPRP